METNPQLDQEVREEAMRGEQSTLNASHELNQAEADDGFVEQPMETAAAAPPDELAKLRSERDALLDRVARLQAEFDNARKRQQREQQEFREYAVTDAVKALLPVIDNFDLALRSGGSGEQLRTGVELIRKQMGDVLTKLNVAPVPAEGHPFDPRMHEAIEMVSTTEAPDNTVLQELQRGYQIKDRLLRPAMVRVARNPKQ